MSNRVKVEKTILYLNSYCSISENPENMLGLPNLFDVSLNEKLKIESAIDQFSNAILESRHFLKPILQNIYLD